MPSDLIIFITFILCIASIIILLVKCFDSMNDSDWKIVRWVPVAATAFMIWVSCAFNCLSPEKRTVNVSIIDNTAICIWNNEALNLNNKFKRQFSEGPLNLIYFPNMSCGISFDRVKLDATSDQNNQ